MANTLKFGNGEWYGKKDTILAYNDENSNYKPLPFDFSRASKATVVNKDGLIETVGSDIPRIDYKDDSEGALLLEPQRSNNVDNSTNFFLNSWSGTRVSGGSTIVSPNGKDEAHKLVATSVDNTHYRECILNSASAGSYTGSCFFKKGEYNVACIRMSVDTYANRYAIYIDLNDGAFLRDSTVGSPTGTSYKIEDYGNGWYRLSVTIIHTSGEVRMSLSNASSDYTNSSGLPVFLGNSSDGGYAWGAQLEEGSYATSYIPTQGSLVTRLEDSCNQTPPDGVIGQTEGTLYAEIDFKSKPEAGSPIVGIMTLNNNVNNLQNCIILGIERQSGGVNRFFPLVRVGNSDVANVIGGTLTDGNYKVAFAYKQNDFILYVNGVQIGADTNGAVPTTSQVLVGERLNGDTFKIADGIKETKLYNTRLSNSELQVLTS